VLGVDRQRVLRITALQRAERRVPGDVTMQNATAVVARQPARNELLRLITRTGFVHRMRERVGRVGVLPPQLEAALRQSAAILDRAVLGM